MLESLKEIGILTNNAIQSLEGEDIKHSQWDEVRDEEELEDFWGCLELILAEVPEDEERMEQFIEECPCGLLLFGEEEPEILSQKFDGSFVKVPEEDCFALMQTISLAAQEALAKGFDEYGQIEDYITRFTQFHRCDEESISDSDRLLILAGTGLAEGSPEEEEFLEKTKEIYLIAQERGMEFYSTYSAEGNSGTILIAAHEKTDA